MGWLCYVHDGEGGFTTLSSRSMSWADVPSTGLLAARVIFAERTRDRTRRKSCIWKGEWVWLYMDEKGVMRFDHSWNVERPIHDRLGVLIPANMLKQGVEISNENWALLYPLKTHDQEDNKVSRW